MFRGSARRHSFRFASPRCRSSFTPIPPANAGPRRSLMQAHSRVHHHRHHRSLRDNYVTSLRTGPQAVCPPTKASSSALPPTFSSHNRTLVGPTPRPPSSALSTRCFFRSLLTSYRGCATSPPSPRPRPIPTATFQVTHSRSRCAISTPRPIFPAHHTHASLQSFEVPCRNVGAHDSLERPRLVDWLL